MRVAEHSRQRRLHFATVWLCALGASASCSDDDDSNATQQASSVSAAASTEASRILGDVEPPKPRRSGSITFDEEIERIRSSAAGLPHADDPKTIRVTCSDPELCWGGACGVNDALVEIDPDGTVRRGSIVNGVQTELALVSTDAQAYSTLRKEVEELGLCALDCKYVHSISHASTFVLDAPCGTGSKRFVLRWVDLEARQSEWKDSPKKPTVPDEPWDEMRKLQRIVDELIELTERPPLLPR